jgi:hypothetical protein
MLIALWIINGLLALVNLAAGLMKLARPREALIKSGQGWVADFTTPTVKLIGLAELLAAIGLILPLAFNVAPILTPLAAIGVVILQIGASTVHARRKEPWFVNIIILILAAASAVLGFIEVLG